MGMSASQARLLSLTARLSDLELQAQSIDNAKIRLSQNSQAAAEAYSDALNSEKITVYSGTSNGSSTYVDASAYNLTNYDAVSGTDKQRFIKTSSGKVLVTDEEAKAYNNCGGDVTTFLKSLSIETNTTKSDYDSAAVTYYTNVFDQIEQNGYYAPGDDNMQDEQYLYDQLKGGNVYLQEWDTQGGTDGIGGWEDASWSSGDATLKTTTDDTKIAKAEAIYETTSAEIQSKDKRFDLELSNIDTEHTAIQTEIDSVKKVIDKNIDRSFKIFNA